MSKRATGTFEVEIKPIEAADASDGFAPPRMNLAKRFAGGLVGTGVGEMMTAMTAVQGSAAYVAIERVTGSLHGLDGSFVFVHRGIMGDGEHELSVSVVPDSGTDDLVGLSGTFAIIVEGGQHSYEFDYTLPE